MFLQVRWPNQQCQSTAAGWLVIQIALNLTRLISPCYNNTTCMHIQDNDTQRNLSTVSEPSEMKQNLVGGIATSMTSCWRDGGAPGPPVPSARSGLEGRECQPIRNAYGASTYRPGMRERENVCDKLVKEEEERNRHSANVLTPSFCKLSAKNYKNRLAREKCDKIKGHQSVHQCTWRRRHLHEHLKITRFIQFFYHSFSTSHGLNGQVIFIFYI